MATANLDITQVDLSDLRLWQDGPPHDVFTRLREDAPAHWSEMRTYDGEPGFWSLSRHEDIRAASMDWGTYSSALGGMMLPDESAVPMDLQREVIISMDPPRHTRVKALFQRAFTPKAIDAHADRVRAIVASALDGLATQGGGDLVRDVGGPVTARVIGSMLGTAPEMDRTLVEWANVGLAFEDPEYRPNLERLYELVQEGGEYVLPLIQERRREPTDDLLTALAMAEVEGDRFSDMEIFMQFGILIAGGTDSTKSVYTSAIHALLQDRAQLDLLRNDPDRIPDAVEEFLRYFPAFSYMRRTATSDVELHGKRIAAGDKVVFWYVSGNRDERVYEDPQQLDVTRSPQHQAFGAGGRHFCLGAALARLELRILIEETLDRLPGLALAGPPARTRSTFLNQFKSLPVVC
jgi:cytochrome P450